MGARTVTTPLDTNLLEELTVSLGGCIATLELALAVTVDEDARRALEACAMVISTSHEHLCRVDAMVFAPGEAAPGEAGPLVMGQEEDAECMHLDLCALPVPGPPQYMCADCGAMVEVPMDEPDPVAEPDPVPAAEPEPVQVA